jgi:NADH dehydrogenase/NADH:ubiquinone oxidoreductase subunit G
VFGERKKMNETIKAIDMRLVRLHKAIEAAEDEKELVEILRKLLAELDIKDTKIAELENYLDEQGVPKEYTTLGRVEMLVGSIETHYKLKLQKGAEIVEALWDSAHGFISLDFDKMVDEWLNEVRNE